MPASAPPNTTMKTIELVKIELMDDFRFMPQLNGLRKSLGKSFKTSSSNFARRQLTKCTHGRETSGCTGIWTINAGKFK